MQNNGRVGVKLNGWVPMAIAIVLSGGAGSGVTWLVKPTYYEDMVLANRERLRALEVQTVSLDDGQDAILSRIAALESRLSAGFDRIATELKSVELQLARVKPGS